MTSVPQHSSSNKTFSNRQAFCSHTFQFPQSKVKLHRRAIPSPICDLWRRGDHACRQILADRQHFSFYFADVSRLSAGVLLRAGAAARMARSLSMATLHVPISTRRSVSPVVQYVGPLDVWLRSG